MTCRGLMTALAATVAGAAVASGVYDDCVFLFEGGRDGFNGGKADGILQKGEIVDELRAGVPTHANHQATPKESGTSNLVWQTEKVNFHAAGMGVQELPCLQCRQYTWPDATDTSKTNWNYGTVNLPMLADLCPTNVYSAVFRVRRGDLNPFKQTQWFMSFGYSTNTDGQGWLLGFANDGTLSTHCTGSSSPGNITALKKTATNTWVNIGVVVTGNVVRYTLAFPGLDPKSEQGGPSQLYHATQTFEKDGFIPNTTMAKANIHIGGQEDGKQCNAPNGGKNNQKFFNGSFQRIAFWNRALSDREIAEAFAFPRPGHVVLGGQNGHADEFGRTDKADATVCADLVQRDSWTNFPASFRAGDVRTITFNMKKEDAMLSQLLVVKPLATSPAALFKISLNGEVLSANEPMKAGEKLKFPIRAFKSRARFLTGANALRIERVDAGEPIAIDAIWLGGSWYVGTQDNCAKQDLGWHYTRSYLEYQDTYAICRALNSKSGATNYNYTACAPADVAESYPVRVGLRYALSASTAAETSDLRMMVDGVEKLDLGKNTSYADYWVTIPAGEHDIGLRSYGTSGTFFFDCYMMTFDPPPAGMSVLIR